MSSISKNKSTNTKVVHVTQSTNDLNPSEVDLESFCLADRKAASRFHQPPETLTVGELRRLLSNYSDESEIAIIPRHEREGYPEGIVVSYKTDVSSAKAIVRCKQLDPYQYLATKLKMNASDLDVD